MTGNAEKWDCHDFYIVDKLHICKTKSKHLESYYEIYYLTGNTECHIMRHA